MWWFNVCAGVASLAGLVFSILAWRLAADAKKRVAAFERHEDALAVLRDVGRCRAEVRAMQRSRGKVWPRDRCDAFAEPLAALLARPLRFTEEERADLRRFLTEINRGEIDNDAAAAGRLRALDGSLAKMEIRFLVAARSEVKSP